MSSAHSARASDVGSAAVPSPDDLEDWQRFLQSKSIAPVHLSNHQDAPIWDITDSEASVWEPLATTLGGLTLNLSVGALAATGSMGSLVLWAFNNLAMVPPAPNCLVLEPQTSTRSRITCLQTAIAAGNHPARAEGLAWIGRWQPSEPLFAEGQYLLDRWSDSALQEARQAAKTEDWGTAIALTAQVPASSPRFAEAQNLLHRLKAHRQTVAQRLNENAQAALREADWATAYQRLWQLEALSHAAAPLPQVAHLAQQITAERQATQLWNEAQLTWESGIPAEQAAAIARASQMSSDTYRWQRVQPIVNQWSDQLWPIVQQRLSEDDGAGAIAMVQQISQNPGRAAQLRPWLQLAQAQQLAVISTADSAPPLSQLVGLPAALMAAQSVPLDETLSATDSALAQQLAIALSPDQPFPALQAATTAKGCLTRADNRSTQVALSQISPPLQRLFPEQSCAPHFGR